MGFQDIVGGAASRFFDTFGSKLPGAKQDRGDSYWDTALPGASQPTGQDFSLPGASMPSYANFNLPGSSYAGGPGFALPGSAQSYRQPFSLPGSARPQQSFDLPGSSYGGNPSLDLMNKWMGTLTPPPQNPTGPQANSGGMNWSGPATSQDNQNLSPANIDAWIAQERPGSPLIGLGQFILGEANARNISVPLLLGIMLLESELGTTGSLNGVYNYGGLTGQGWGGQTGNTTGMARQFATFATREDGVRALMDNLASNGYRGKSVQQQIGNWYLGDPNASLGSTDEQQNATLQQYLNVVARAYQGLGVGYNPQGTPTATGSSYADPTGLLAAAQPLLGNPYELGGRRANGKVGPGIGIDCSEFTAYLYEQQGITLQWNAQAQYNQTQRVQQGQWQPGDLIFFQGTYDTGRGETVTHVGMFVGYDAHGNPIMVHSGSNGVEYANLNQPYYQQHYYGAGRVPGVQQRPTPQDPTVRRS